MFILSQCLLFRNLQKDFHRAIEGCFVPRLDYNCIRGLSLLFFNNEDVFDLYADRVYEKKVNYDDKI